MNDFAKAWAIAGDEMERMRNERLQKLVPEAGARLMGAVESSSEEDLNSNGLAKWQAWMMRWRVKILIAKNDATTGIVEEKLAEDA